MNSCRDNIATYGVKRNSTAEPPSTVRQTDSKTKIKMRRRLYNSNYIGMAGYLMDFGFGGFIGYGKGVSVGLVIEELNRCDR